MATVRERVLILCKTYPSPSGKYSETSCVAGVRENGDLIRLFPIPFRLIRNEQQFRKWQWTTIQFQKAKNDHRPESHTVNIDAIECDQPPLPTSNNWELRRAAIAQSLTLHNFDQVEQTRQRDGNTLAFLKPSRIVGLDITPVKDPDWTREELEKLSGYQKQAGLFDDPKEISLLRKMPFDFHYKYVCEVDGVENEYRHKIVDWEAGMLFWHCHSRYGVDWEKPFRDKLEVELPSKDLIFLMGTIHRFPDKWLIVSLIYPPRQPPAPKTPDLFG